MIHAYIQKRLEYKGQGRFLRGLEATKLIKFFTYQLISSLPEIDKADSVIIAGCLPQEAANINHDKIYYCYNSPIGQADLSSMGIPSDEIKVLYDTIYLIKEKKLFGCVVSSDSIEFVYKDHNFVAVPHIVNIDYNRYKEEFVSKINKDRKNYGFLGNNLRKHRNTHAQLLAMSRLDPKEKIVVSKGFPVSLYETLENIQFKTIDILNDEDFYKEIASHRLGFQASFSESFNYLALEYSLLGVPIICSPCIFWYPHKELVIQRPDDVKIMCETAQKVLNSKDFYENVSEKIHLWAYYKNNEEICKAIKVLEKLK